MGTDVFQVLFNSGDLRLTLEEYGKSIRREVEAAPEGHVVQVDVEGWTKGLTERYRVEAPVLKQPYMDRPEPVQVDVSRDANRFIRDRSRPFRVPGHKVLVHIPYSGDGHVFSLQPSSYVMRRLQAGFGENELLLEISYADDKPVNIKLETDTFIELVERNLTAARSDIEQFNQSLADRAHSAIDARQDRIRQHAKHIEATGLPIGPPNDPSKTYIADSIVRRPAPPLPTAADGKPMELEPVLADDVYEHILSDIRHHSRAMEQNPRTYAGMGEEDRRNVILNMLAANYPGGTAEGFNYSGKTDILLRHGTRNIFVAECKFWTGSKGFLETVDQLFGYQAWRDTKLAILMFVREIDLTAIIEKARAALEERPQFVEWRSAASETELRATVHWSGDERRLADLNVFFIPTPTE